MTRKEQFVLIFLGAAMITGAAGVYMVQSRTPAPEAEAPASVMPMDITPANARPPDARIHLDPPSDNPAETPDVRVAVQGAVPSPGVYTLDTDDRVEDLLSAAGGPLPGADLSNINRAARLIDGTTLTVPYAASEGILASEPFMGGDTAAAWNPPQYTVRGWAMASGPVDMPQGASSGAAAGFPRTVPGNNATLNLNTATQAELETLPGIGPALASSILRYREQGLFRRVDDLLNVSGIGEKRLDAIREFVAVR